MENGYWWIIILVIILIGVAVGVVLANNKKKTEDNGVDEDGDTSQPPLETVTYGIFTNKLYGYSANYKTQIQAASERWTALLNEPNTTSITITYNTYNQPNGSTLAYAYMSNTTNIRGGGGIGINRGRDEPVCGWNEVIEHEICHVLGLPSFTEWQNNIITSNGNTYLRSSAFTDAAIAYTEITGEVGNIPLEDGGNHWKESIFATELMTPSIGSESNLITSKLTLGALKDMGWTEIKLDDAESFPS